MTCFLRGSRETIRAAIADLRADMLRRGTVILGTGRGDEMVIEVPGMDVGDIEDRRWFGGVTAVYQDRALADAVRDEWYPPADTVSGGNATDE
jgi:hypothetical protein